MAEFDRNQVEQFADSLRFVGNPMLAFEAHARLMDCLKEIDRREEEYVQMVHDYALVRQEGYERGLEDAVKVVDENATDRNEWGHERHRMYTTCAITIGKQIRALMDTPKEEEK
jgi:hypothetical protein